MKKLPKKFQGAAVVRGRGMDSAKLTAFLEKKAVGQFCAMADMWIVIADGALGDLDDTVEVKGFSSEADALRVARACAHGNIDHRVLRVTQQTLVVATLNEL